MACKKHGYKGNKSCHACGSSSIGWWVIAIIILIILF